MSSHNIYESSPIQTYGNVLDMVVEYGFGGDSQGWRLRALTAVLMLCWLAFPPGCDAVLDVDTTVNAPKDIAIPATGDYDREELQVRCPFRPTNCDAETDRVPAKASQDSGWHALCGCFRAQWKQVH